MQSVQIMRGLAAIAVVFFHTHVILSNQEYGSIGTFGYVATKGWIGVNFFFVLSGFIILFAHFKDIGIPAALPKYFLRRFTRLYPIYWILLTAYISAAAFGIGHPDFKWEVAHLMSSYTLLNIVDLVTLPLKVAWTLLFEVKFYIIFAVLIASRRIGICVMVIWTVAILVRNAFSPPPDWGYLAPDWGMLNIWNINFIFGMVTCWLIKRHLVRYGALLLAAGVLLLAFSSYNIVDTDPSKIKPAFMMLVALSFSMIVAGSVTCEINYEWRFPSLPILLGNASYSIYLIHSAVISLMAGINFKIFHGRFPDIMVFVLIFFFAVAAGIIIHLIIEKPLLKWLRQVAGRLNKPAVGTHP
jgi:peptidoglycan/LPS O-acetylase OafA/YrhL